jgi:alanyl-tRNA synthetase
MYYYNLTCKVQEKWTQSRIMQFLNIKHSTSIQLLRVYQFPALNKPGGWHFSYFGNIEFIKNKLKNFCHAGEDRIEIITEKNISDALKSNSDLFGRSNFMTVPIEENTYLPENYGMLKF